MQHYATPKTVQLLTDRPFFLRHNLKGCTEKLKQTAYFSLIRSFMDYGTSVWDPYQRYNSVKVERIAPGSVKRMYKRYPNVSDMLD